MAMLRTTLPSHLPSLARCHAAAFPHSLSTALGQRYVAKMLSWYLSSDKTFIFHIEDEHGQCAGYCGGIVSDGTLGTGSASGMAQHTFTAAIWAFLTHPWVLFHPEVRAKWPLLWKNILMKLGLRRRVHFSPEQKEKMAREPQVGLVVIGVDPKYQGKGYGSLLLKEFERKAVEEFGIRNLQLSVLADNHKAIKAYERNGWKKHSIHGKSLSMIKKVE
ncbi:MAG: GNAT family N-acetyltransferase [Thermaurantimonas sp.]|uniref:GNAT family N-acetyltransferase n=1 Tax=Thermaurantimonas sp. TaxID=2681568 RepID=UPI00391B27D1